MKASELIEDLRKLIELYGDLPVVLDMDADDPVDFMRVLSNWSAFVIT